MHENTFRFAFAAFTAMSIFSAIAQADDTKIYTGSNSVSGTVKPNIMLLLDTSGSMADEAVYRRVATYDPSYAYSEEDKYGNTCAMEFYWSHGDDQDDVDPLGTAGCGDTRRFLPHHFQCLSAVTDLNTNGAHYDLYAEYLGYLSNPRWDNPSTGRSTGHASDEVYQECYSDSGLHGKSLTTVSIQDNTGLTNPSVVHEVKVGTDDGSNRVVPKGDKSDNPGAHPWGPAGTTKLPWPESNGYSNDITVLHPNYVRYLYGYEDLNGNGSYDAGEGYTDTINDGAKIDILKDVMTDLVTAWSGVNVGIMRYNIRHGATVLHPVVDIDDATNRTNLLNIIASLDASDATPHAEALYETFNYFRGWRVEFGNANGSSHRPPASALNPQDTTRYASPVKFSCQANAIIHMTDGRPTRDGGTESSDGTPFPVLTLKDETTTTDDVDVAIHDLDGFSAISDASCDMTSSSTETDGITPDNCHDELAEYMATKPQTVDILKEDGTIEVTTEVEPIRTFVVGFDLDLPYLLDTANKGNGEYYTARNRDALRNAFDTMVENIKNAGTKQISPPGVAVEAFSRSMHLNELYFNLFQPGTFPLYPGNLKKFKLKYDSANDRVDIVDENDVPALDLVNGGFKSTSRSFWSATADGDNVDQGGMVENFQLARNVYTYTGTSLSLTHSSNLFHESNSAIGTGTGELELSMSEVGERDNVIRWGRGLDAFDEDGDGITNEVRHSTGDPLHSRPTLIVYDTDSDDDLTHDDPDMLVTTLTNDGLLHAVDSNTGVEQWAFVPKATWKTLNAARKNTQSTKIYGLDGQLTAWIEDTDGDGVLETGNGEWAHLYFGMRRGGSNYYALDVSSKSSPKILWEINGGSGNYATLGQTWGQLQRAVININGTATRVLVASGGYDLAYDTAYSTMPTATVGNDIFIIDENDGSLIWRARMTAASDDINQANMQYAFPAEPVVLDMNRDGFHDRIYAVDISGQLWRFDIQNGNIASDLVVGAVFARLGDLSNFGENNRKFYNQPDIALLEADSNRYIAVNVGSGHRADPLDDTVKDAFFSIRDPYSYGSHGINSLLTDLNDFNITPITKAQLTDISDYTGTPDPTHGWFFMLNAAGGWIGEKALANSVTVDNEVLFTTYEPPTTATADGCVINIGKSRLYTVSLLNGTATFDANNDGVIDDSEADKEGRTEELDYAGIPPAIVVLFPQTTAGRPVGCVGPECKTLPFGNSLRRSYWYMPNRDPVQ